MGAPYLGPSSGFPNSLAHSLHPLSLEDLFWGYACARRTAVAGSVVCACLGPELMDKGSGKNTINNKSAIELPE